MAIHDFAGAVWRKSTRSTAESNCVEVAFAPEAVAVRDTKDRDGGMLAFPTAAWQAFAHGHAQR